MECNTNSVQQQERQEPHPPLYGKPLSDSSSIFSGPKQKFISKRRQRRLANRLSKPRNEVPATLRSCRLDRVLGHDFTSCCITKDELISICEVCEWSTCQLTRKDCASALKALAMIDSNLDLLSKGGALSALLSLISSANHETDMVLVQEATTALARMMTCEEVRKRVMMAPDGIPQLLSLLRSPSRMTRRVAFHAIRNLASSEQAKLYLLSNKLLKPCGAIHSLENNHMKKEIVRDTLGALLDTVLPPPLASIAGKHMARSDRTILLPVARLIRLLCTFHLNKLHFVRQFPAELKLIIHLAMDSKDTKIQKEMMLLLVELTRGGDLLPHRDSAKPGAHRRVSILPSKDQANQKEKIAEIVNEAGVEAMLQSNLNPDTTPLPVVQLAMELLQNLTGSKATAAKLFEKDCTRRASIDRRNSESGCTPIREGHEVNTQKDHHMKASIIDIPHVPRNNVNDPKAVAKLQRIQRVNVDSKLGPKGRRQSTGSVCIDANDYGLLEAAFKLIFVETRTLMRYRVATQCTISDAQKATFKAEDAIRLSGLKFVCKVLSLSYLRDVIIELGVVQYLLNDEFLAASDTKQIALIAKALALVADTSVSQELITDRHQLLLGSGVLTKFVIPSLYDVNKKRGTYQIHECVITLLANLAYGNEAKHTIVDPKFGILEAVVQHHNCLPSSIVLKHVTSLPQLFALLTEDGRCAKRAVEVGAVGILGQFLSPRRKVKEGQLGAARAMANISSFPEFRSIIVESGVLSHLVLLSRMTNFNLASSSVLRLYAKASLKNLAQHAAALRIQVVVRGYLARTWTTGVVRKSHHHNRHRRNSDRFKAMPLAFKASR